MASNLTSPATTTQPPAPLRATQPANKTVTNHRQAISQLAAHSLPWVAARTMASSLRMASGSSGGRAQDGGGLPKVSRLQDRSGAQDSGVAPEGGGALEGNAPQDRRGVKRCHDSRIYLPDESSDEGRDEGRDASPELDSPRNCIRFGKQKPGKPWDRPVRLRPSLDTLAIGSVGFERDARQEMAWRAGLQDGQLKVMARQLAAHINGMSPVRVAEALRKAMKYQHLDAQDKPPAKEQPPASHTPASRPAISSQPADYTKSERRQPSGIQPIS